MRLHVASDRFKKDGTALVMATYGNDAVLRRIMRPLHFVFTGTVYENDHPPGTPKDIHHALMAQAHN